MRDLMEKTIFSNDPKVYDIHETVKSRNLSEDVETCLKSKKKLLQSDIINFLNYVSKPLGVEPKRKSGYSRYTCTNTNCLFFCMSSAVLESLKNMETVLKFSEDTLLTVIKTVISCVHFNAYVRYYDDYKKCPEFKYLTSCVDACKKLEYIPKFLVSEEKHLFNVGLDMEFNFLKKSSTRMDFYIIRNRIENMYFNYHDKNDNEKIFKILEGVNEQNNIKNIMKYSNIKVNIDSVEYFFSFVVDLYLKDKKLTEDRHIDIAIRAMIYLKNIFGYNINQTQICWMSNHLIKYDKEKEHNLKNFDFQIFSQTLNKIITKFKLNKVKIDFNLKNFLLENEKDQCLCGELFVKIVKTLFENKYLLYTTAEEFDDSICACKSSKTQIALLKYTSDKFKHVVGQKIWNHCFKFCEYELFSYLITLPQNKIKFDQTHVDMLLKTDYCKDELLVFLLDQKIVPTKECLEKFCMQVYQSREKKEHIIEIIHKYNKNIVVSISELLQIAGLKISGFDVPNESVFFDDVELYIEKKKYTTPAYEKKIIKEPASEIILESLFLTRDLEHIKEYMIKHKLNPTVRCFEFGLQNDRDDVLKYILEEQNFKPSVLHILSISKPMERLQLLKRFYPELCTKDYKGIAESPKEQPQIAQSQNVNEELSRDSEKPIKKKVTKVVKSTTKKIVNKSN